MAKEWLPAKWAFAELMMALRASQMRDSCNEARPICAATIASELMARGTSESTSILRLKRTIKDLGSHQSLVSV
jgi:hypothetical protein